MALAPHASRERTPLSAGPCPADALLRQERALRLVLATTVATAVPTLAAALLSGSMLVLTDLLDYGRALVTNIMGWRILHLVRAGKLRGYDYGAGKVQALGGLVGASLYLGMLLVLAGVSVRRLVIPVPLHAGFTLFAVGVQAGNGLLNGWLWIRNRRLARAAFSPVMDMQWRADRAATIGTAATLAGLGLTLAFRRFPASVYLDPLCALAFIGYVAASFLPVLADGLNEVLDRTLAEHLQLRIDRRLAEHFDGYAGFHGVRSRRSGGRVFIEIALSFDRDRSVGQAVDTVEHLRRGIEADIPGSDVRVTLVPGADRMPDPADEKR